MHKKLCAIIVSAIMTGSLLCPYMASAKSNTVSSPKQITQFDKNNKLGFLKGDLSNEKTKDMNGVIEFFNENKDLFSLENPKDSLKQMSIKVDQQGNTHIKVQQVYNGTAVFGKEYMVHFDKSGKIYAVNGNLDVNISKKFTPSKSTSTKISESKAIDIAKKNVKVSDTLKAPTAKQYIYNVDGEYMPVYDVNLISVNPSPANWHVYVHSETGDVVNKVNSVDSVSAIGQGVGVLGDNKGLNLDYDMSTHKYSMTDTTTPTGAKITTYDASKVPTQWGDWYASYFLPGDLYSKTTNKFTEQGERSAVDAHKYARDVYNYYLNNFNRNSLDDKGMEIISSVHYGKNWVNAAWIGTQMIYGDGDNKSSIALAGSLDVIGHEMTHGVTEHECNLTYENQSGALNESMSDTFGTLIEFAAQPDKADYLLGEDVWTPGVAGDALRDMENPAGTKGTRPQPAHMKDYVNTSEDHGGVHTNSGIPNKAAAIIIKSLGTEKAGKIYYKALTNYLVSSSDFHAARLALLQSAAELYGENSSEYTTVGNAFTTVGIQ